MDHIIRNILERHRIRLGTTTFRRLAPNRGEITFVVCVCIIVVVSVVVVIIIIIIIIIVRTRVNRDLASAHYNNIRGHTYIMISVHRSVHVTTESVRLGYT